MSILLTNLRHARKWFHSDAPHLGAINTLSASIAKAEQQHPGVIPGLRQMPTLLRGSDYGGMHRSADFEVITLLASNLETIHAWDSARSMVRDRLLPDQRRISSGHIALHALPMGSLASALNRQTGRAVIDKTGLNGNYDLDLQWPPDMNSSPTESGAPGIASTPEPLRRASSAGTTADFGMCLGPSAAFKVESCVLRAGGGTGTLILAFRRELAAR